MHCTEGLEGQDGSTGESDKQGRAACECDDDDGDVFCTPPSVGSVWAFGWAHEIPDSPHWLPPVLILFFFANFF